MLVTFSKSFAIDHANLARVVFRAVEQTACDNDWEENLVGNVEQIGPRRVRFTLRTLDSFKAPSRTSGSGRHMPKASWEAHRQVMEKIFAADTNATIKSALATYCGLEDFRTKYANTFYHNCGSRVAPAYIGSCDV